MSLTRDMLIAEYQRFLKEEDLIMAEARVDAGGAMVMFGLRETTSDIDLSVTTLTCERIVTERQLLKCSLGGDHYLAAWSDVVDIHPNPGMIGTTIEGVYVQYPEEILELKLSLNRPKDQEDIRILKAHLGL